MNNAPDTADLVPERASLDPLTFDRRKRENGQCM
jgi:hypothetical protein